MVKWSDNKAVTLASYFMTSGTVDNVQRYDKKLRECVTAERPDIVVGGADKSDQMISSYRIL